MNDTKILNELISLLLSCERSSKPRNSRCENVSMRQDSNMFVVNKTKAGHAYGSTPREAIINFLNQKTKMKGS